MQIRIAFASVVVALATTITTLSFAQHRDAVTPTTGTKVRELSGSFTQYDSIPWQALSTKQPGLQMYVVWGNPDEGSAEIVQKFPAGWDSGWHWHSASYEGVVVQGRWTHTFKGAASQTEDWDLHILSLRDKSMTTGAKRARDA
jgi:hypothetical protein